MICTTCGSASGTKTITPGSLGVEIILWIIFIGLSLTIVLSPGLLIPFCYSLWRFLGKKKGCAKCGGVVMVSKDSPMGIKLLKDLQP